MHLGVVLCFLINISVCLSGLLFKSLVSNDIVKSFGLIGIHFHTGFDESKERSYPCDHQTSIRVNKFCGYSCECKDGFSRGSSDKDCVDVDECLQNVCDKLTTTCHNIVGGYECKCKEGFEELIINKCSDIDECVKKECDVSSTTCENVIGSFKCNCKPGFKPLNNTNCTDIDECKSNNHKCDPSTTTCTNIEGSYSCKCKLGFEKIHLNHTSCEDIDECSNKKSICDSNSAVCRNNLGGYECQCKNGFDRVTPSIPLDVDECLLKENEFEPGTNNTGKVPSKAGKVAAGLVPVVVVITGIFFVVLWKRKFKQNSKLRIQNSNRIYENLAAKRVVQQEPSRVRIKVEDLDEHIRSASEKFGNENEFKAIALVEQSVISYERLCNLKCNNQVQNTIPHDQARINLTRNGSLDRYNDYFNACNITGFTNTVPYIVARDPTKQTVNDFWRMVSEENVNVIVMLSQLAENNKKRCNVYWPETEGNVAEFDNILVLNSSVIVWENFKRRDFKVVRKEDNSTRIVTQWQFLGWPEHGVPTDVQSYLRFRNNVRAWMVKSGKTLVHCGSGVGRTGCFIAIDVLLKEAATRGSVDVVSCVSELRRQRPHMVQTAEQYYFIYLAIKRAFEEPCAYIPIPSYHKHYLEISKERRDGQSKLFEEYEKLLGESHDYSRSNLSREITTQSDKWKVYSADGVNIPNKYIFASFPSESDVDEFWKICMEHAHVIVLLDSLKDLRLSFLSHNVKPFQNKENDVKITQFEIPYLIDSSVSGKQEREQTELKTKSFSVIHLFVNNKDFIPKEVFMAAKNQIDQLPPSNTLERPEYAVFVLSRDNMKLSSFLVACCKLFEQMESYKEVSIYNTVLELHKGVGEPIISKTQYRKLYEIVDKEVTSYYSLENKI